MPIKASFKPRLLVVSATYVVEENRKKLDALAKHFEVVCATCAEHTAYSISNRVDADRQPANYRIIGLPAVGRPESTTKYWLRGLGGVFRRFPADVVLVEAEPWAWIRWQAWWLKTRCSRRAIFGEFSWENLERPGWKGAILGLFYRAAKLTDDFAIVGNRAAREIFVRHGQTPARLLVSPQLGVDPVLFHPVDGPTRDRLRRETGIPPGAFLVGFCGRLVESKGLRELVEAVHLARAHLPVANIHLSLLGYGPMRDELSALVGASSFLHLLPPRSHAEVASYMQGLDLFVLPSKPQNDGSGLWVEQFGFVLIQAMACGVATVGSASGAIPDVIDIPEAIFPAGDAHALAATLVDFIGNQTRRTEMAGRQRRQTLARYANEELGTTWADFIRQFLPPRASNSR